VFDQITPLVVELAASPLVYVVLFALCLVDGFFPPVPSESALVAIAAIAATSGQPVLAVVLIAAALGAIAGDSIAYWIGRRIGFARLARSKRPRIAAAFAFAERQMQRRSASLILTGRFIPVGRVAVNMTAGATRLSYRRFLAISAIAGLAWSAVSPWPRRACCTSRSSRPWCRWWSPPGSGSRSTGCSVPSAAGATPAPRSSPQHAVVILRRRRMRRCLGDEAASQRHDGVSRARDVTADGREARGQRARGLPSTVWSRLRRRGAPAGTSGPWSARARSRSRRPGC
jgi:membrane protein DedA with SNARE-associated domain